MRPWANCHTNYMQIDIRQSLPTDPDAASLLLTYMEDVASRWYGRPATANELTQALADEPADGLIAPNGYLAVTYIEGTSAGIGGLRFVGNRVAELTKIFTLPASRGSGVASQVLDHLENVALRRERIPVRLDTRSDLVEACRLYEKRGYQRINPFAASSYSDRFYGLHLSS